MSSRSSAYSSTFDFDDAAPERCQAFAERTGAASSASSRSTVG